MKKILTQTMKKETVFLSSLFEDAVKNVINDFMISNKDFSKDLFNSQVGRIGPLFDLLNKTILTDYMIRLLWQKWRKTDLV